MIKALRKKLGEALTSVFPVTAIVFILNLTPLVEFSKKELIVFLVSSLLLILGIALFNLGADLAMTPMGEHIGIGLTKTKKLSLLLIRSVFIIRKTRFHNCIHLIEILYF